MRFGERSRSFLSCEAWVGKNGIFYRHYLCQRNSTMRKNGKNLNEHKSHWWFYFFQFVLLFFLLFRDCAKRFFCWVSLVGLILFFFLVFFLIHSSLVAFFYAVGFSASTRGFCSIIFFLQCFTPALGKFAKVCHDRKF